MAASGLSGAAARQRRRVRIIRVATLIGLALVWEAVARSGIVYKGVVPSLVLIAEALIRELATRALYLHFAVTLGEIAAGFAIAAVLGVGAGLVLGSRRFLGAAADPYIAAVATTPKIVFLPIVMLLTGIGPGSKVALGALSAFFPIVIATAAGMRAIRPVYVRVGRAFKLSAMQMARKVYLPALALPIVSGLRLGLGVCVIGVLLGEIKFSKAGLGFLANDYYNQFRIPELYAAILIVFGLAALANAGMNAVAGRVRAA